MKKTKEQIWTTRFVGSKLIISNKVWNQINDQVKNQVEHQIWNQIHFQIWIQTKRKLGIKTLSLQTQMPRLLQTHARK